jgi:hypothetical protein
LASALSWPHPTQKRDILQNRPKNKNILQTRLISQDNFLFSSLYKPYAFSTHTTARKRPCSTDILTCPSLLVFVSSSLQLLPLYFPCPCTSSSYLTAPILLSPSSLSFCIEIYTDCVSLTRQHQQYFHTADMECRNKNNYTKQIIIIITVITLPSSF